MKKRKKLELLRLMKLWRNKVEKGTKSPITPGQGSQGHSTNQFT